MPIDVLTELVSAAAKWLERAWAKLGDEEKLPLWRRIWDASVNSQGPEDGWDIDAAINYAAGILAGVLYEELAENIPNPKPGQNEGFPIDLKIDFERLAESDNLSAKLARVRMAPMLFTLYRVNPDWTIRVFFSRMNPEDTAKFDAYIWEAFFLWGAVS